MTEHDPIPLCRQIPVQKAVELFFPYGGIKVATLMAEIRRGNLTYTRLGRAYFVTEQDIEEWVRKCRKLPRDRASISTGEQGESRPTSSETERTERARASALLRAEGLTKRSRPIVSAPSGPTPENVISLKSGLPRS